MTDVNIPDLVARLKQREAELGNPRLVPRSMHGAEELYNERLLISRTIAGLSSVPRNLAVREAQLAEAEGHRALMVAAQAKLEADLRSASDVRALRGNAYDREWQRQLDIKKGLEVIWSGAPWSPLIGGPAVPGPLTEALGGVTIDADGRRVAPWYGSLPALNERVAELRSLVADHRRELERHLTHAAALLAEEAAKEA
jgi:hypothetical protein